MTTRSLSGLKRRPRALRNDGTSRARPVDWEGQEQAVLIRWLLGEKKRGEPVGRLYDAIYHVPNGGQRSKSTGAALKRQGVKSGVSDLVVMEARGGWHGLYMEFKASPPHTAALAQSQHDWLALAEARGYCAVLAVGLEEAKRVLDEYACLGPSYSQYTKANVRGTEWRKG
ncbi:VRR-NUC domain-containing protein [Halomonas sp. Mc5H-6]|uniref:VRR-NUC domain-containing protein n=1 Tax=Halomonas sp. Mc5H-6 TaxID=2954500 RepID=UPI0020982F25|nr:VRR-NUC domain-containing protein [Halomonas sp. Mc5H-6]MCO7246389.1 VRR-NUC domain-containing protein [Halomonas sp. Mc5H-6]